MKPFQVTVDPDLETIMPRYMEIQFRELGLMEEALASGNSEAVRMLGHKLKGSGTSYGFPALTELGAATEIAGKADDLTTASKLIGQIRSYLENVEIIYGESE